MSEFTVTVQDAEWSAGYNTLPVAQSLIVNIVFDGVLDKFGREMAQSLISGVDILDGENSGQTQCDY